MTCTQGHPLEADGSLGLSCREDCAIPAAGADDSGPQPPVGDTSPRADPTVRATVGDVDIELAPGVATLVGRDPASPLSRALHPQYGNVGRRHLTLTARDGGVDVTPHPSRNRTFAQDTPLDADRTYHLLLPCTLRMGSNCYLRIEAARE